MSNVSNRRTRSQKSSQTENHDQVVYNENITGTDLNEDKVTFLVRNVLKVSIFYYVSLLLVKFGKEVKKSPYLI